MTAREHLVKLYCVYIMTNYPYGTLYVGVTSDLRRRVYEHREGLIDGFTKRHALRRLVYYECTSDVHAALNREKRLKRWKRVWKVKLIESVNPKWEDLWDEISS